MVKRTGFSFIEFVWYFKHFFKLNSVNSFGSITGKANKPAFPHCAWAAEAAGGSSRLQHPLGCATSPTWAPAVCQSQFKRTLLESVNAFKTDSLM